MIRAVLVGWAVDDWRLYRQPQWMAEVRRSPESAQLPRHHFDIEDDAFRVALERWAAQGASDLQAATELLAALGAVEVVRP
jgi:hypothetical protein